ncbi:hypothetical protein IM511_08010 [Erythrobacteraceae bacterium E2-1 Yellow Sea]|nr:hypothetical protein [Erythrobacteraceae bacterium E2-1 Yellow Sea]
MIIEGENWADPYIFTVGLFLTMMGLVLTQVVRDSPKLNSGTAFFPFGLTRKMGAFEVFGGSILGFWIVGWVWLLALPFLWIASPIAARLFPKSSTLPRTSIAITLIGLICAIWAQSPLLKAWGLMP